MSSTQPSLFPLSPIGNGTAAVESLHSYILRLAKAHGVTAAQIIRHIWRFGKTPGCRDEDEPDGNSVLNGPIVTLNRTGPAREQFVERVQRTTGNTDLAWITFSPLSAQFNRAEKTYSKHTRWCPACMAEADHVDAIPYYQLLCQLLQVKCCPIHGAELIDRCIQCGADQDSRGYRSAASKCQECGGCLYDASSVMPAEEGCDDDCSDLVALFDRYRDLPRKGRRGSHIREDVDAMYWWYRERATPGRFLEDIDRRLLISMHNVHNTMTLNNVRTIAYEFRVPLYELMTDGLKQLPLNLAEVPTNRKPQFMARAKRARHNRHVVLERVLRHVQESDEPPSLKEVAQAGNVSTGYLRYRFPALTQSLIRRRREHDERRRAELEIRALQLVREYRACLQAQHVEQGVKKTVNYLSARHGLSKYLLRRCIRRLDRRSRDGDD